MMRRTELNDEMMGQINGGEYLVFTYDTNEFIGSYTFRGVMREVVRALNGYGVDVIVKTTNWMDDSDAAGVYMAEQCS